MSGAPLHFFSFSLSALQSEKLQADKRGICLLSTLLCPGSLNDFTFTHASLGSTEGQVSKEGDEPPINLSSLSAVRVGCRGVWGPRLELREFLRAQGGERGAWGDYEREVEKVILQRGGV